MPVSRVGPYVLVRELARGGMGVVFEAQAPDGARVALKVLAQASPEALLRFDRERRLLVELSGAPGFVPLLDAGLDRGRPWLAMALMAGGSLRDRLRRGTLSVEDAVALGHQLGVAIGRAHARGIVHRDLKPENVLFEHEGPGAAPRIADLGVARHFRHEGADGARSVSLSRSGAMLGTACYMSPEQLTDPRRVGPPADVFALAQIVYECVAGVTPFARESLHETMTALADGRPDPLRARAPHAPAWLEAVLARALDADPARRFPDGQAFARALALGSRAPAPRRSRRAVAWLAVGVLSLAVPGVALVVVRPERQRDASAPPASTTGDAPTAPDVAVADARGADDAPDVEDEPRAHAAPAAEAPAVEAPAAEAPAAEAPAAEAAGAKALDFDPRDARAWMEHAVALRRAGRLEEAIEAYRRAVELRPGSDESTAARGGLIVTLRDAGRIDEAAVEADRLVAVTKRVNPWSLLLRGRILVEAHQLRGLSDLEKVTELLPTSSQAWAMLSVGRIRAREYAKALEAADRALSLDGSPAVALRSRGLARLVLGDVEGARDDLARYRAGLDAAEAARDAELQAGLARAFGAPSDPAPDARAEATRLVEEAWLVRAVKDTGAAVSFVERALALAPDHAEALAMKGSVTGGDEGRAMLDRAIELGPVRGWMMRERAILRYQRRDYPGAVADVERLIALDGTVHADLFMLARFMRLAGDPRAVATAEAVTKLDPTVPAGWVLLARLRRERGDPAAALEAARRATETGPDEVGAWRELGTVYLELRRFEEAVAALERLLELAPDDLDAFTDRAMAVGLSGRVADGIRDLERAVKERPDSGRSWLALAACHAAARDAEATIAAADRALALLPDNLAALRFRALAREALGDHEGARRDLASFRAREPSAIDRDPELKALEERLSR